MNVLLPARDRVCNVTRTLHRVNDKDYVTDAFPSVAPQVAAPGDRVLVIHKSCRSRRPFGRPKWTSVRLAGCGSYEGAPNRRP